MKFNYKEDYKIKLSNIKHRFEKIKDFEFDITDIFYDVILNEIVDVIVNVIVNARGSAMYLSLGSKYDDMMIMGSLTKGVGL